MVSVGKARQARLLKNVNKTFSKLRWPKPTKNENGMKSSLKRTDRTKFSTNLTVQVVRGTVLSP